MTVRGGPVVVLVALVCATLGCGGAKDSRAPLGTVAEFRDRAFALGCTGADMDYFGAGAFSCMKVIASCGCAILVKADASAGKLNLVRVDLVGCRAGEAEPHVSSLLDPLFHPDGQAKLHEFIAGPKVYRDDAQMQRLAVLQSERVGDVNVRALFGAAHHLSIGAARRILWIEPTILPASSSLIADTPVAPPCRLVPRESREFETRGYCDHAPQETPPCELDLARRSAYRSEVALRVGHALSEWQAAVRTLMFEHVLDESMSSEETAKVLVSVLPRNAASGGVPIPVASIWAGRPTLQLAAEAAAAWRDSIIWNEDVLSDVDLARLVLDLPGMDEVSARVLVERIRFKLESQPAQESAAP